MTASHDLKLSVLPTSTPNQNSKSLDEYTLEGPSDLLEDGSRVHIGSKKEDRFTTLLINSRNRQVISARAMTEYNELLVLDTGKHVATWKKQFQRSDSIDIWDMKEDQPIAIIHTGLANIASVAQHENRHQIIVGDQDYSTFQTWDIENPRNPKKIATYNKTSSLGKYSGIAYNDQYLFLSGYLTREEIFVYDMQKSDLPLIANLPSTYSICSMKLTNNFLVSRHRSPCNYSIFQVRVIADILNPVVVDSIIPKLNDVSRFPYQPIHVSQDGCVVTEYDIKLESKILNIPVKLPAALDVISTDTNPRVFPDGVNGLIWSYLFQAPVLQKNAVVAKDTGDVVKVPRSP